MLILMNGKKSWISFKISINNSLILIIKSNLKIYDYLDKINLWMLTITKMKITFQIFQMTALKVKINNINLKSSISIVKILEPKFKQLPKVNDKFNKKWQIS